MTATVVDVTAVTVARAEGYPDECVSVTVTERCWEQADEIVNRWRASAPGPGEGGHKTDITATFADGTSVTVTALLTNYEPICCYDELRDTAVAYAALEGEPDLSRPWAALLERYFPPR